MWSASERLVTIQDWKFLNNKGGVPEPPEPGDPVEPVDPSDPSINTAGGGGLYTEGGPVAVTRSEFTGNSASEEGGGIENSAFRVTFDRLTVSENYAGIDGGGIYNSSSGEFFLLNSTIARNSGSDGGGFANAPDNDLVIRNSLLLRNVARRPGLSEDGDIEEGGHGGGFFSLADGDALIENTTISGNVAATGGGSVKGGSCDWFITSEGGNLDTGGKREYDPMAEILLPPQTACFLAQPANSDSTAAPKRDRRSPDFTIDAIADNGGPTLTHRLNWGSLAIDAGVTPCPDTDVRGVTRPQNSRCDIGSFEFVGDPPPFDDTPPETVFVSGPIQDTPETVAYTFTGSDDQTLTKDLNYECRLLELDLVEEPEVLAPWDPVDPEEQWVGCSSPFPGLLLEEGGFRFEVRAVDRADNTDPTPAIKDIPGDLDPPQTIIAEKPPLLTNSRTATFTFSGTDDMTPPQFMEFECRLDSRDPEMWLEC